MQDLDQLTPIPGIPFPEYYEFFMDWKTPIALATTYAIVIHTLNPKSNKASRVEAKNKGIKDVSNKSGPLMTGFVFLHNLALAIYSGVTFVNMAIALHKTLHRDLPFKDIVSD